MTVKRKPSDDPLDHVENLTWGPGTKAYRLILLGAVLSATPIGQNILNSVGIQSPLMKEIADVKTNVETVRGDVNSLKNDLDKVKDDVKNVKTDVAAVKNQADRWESTFSSFQVDFEKFKKSQTNGGSSVRP